MYSSFQMDLFLLLIIFALLQLVSSQQDNDGNDVDNDQDLTIQAFGNVITPIKGKNVKFAACYQIVTNRDIWCTLRSLLLSRIDWIDVAQISQYSDIWGIQFLHLSQIIMLHSADVSVINVVFLHLLAHERGREGGEPSVY